MTRCKSHWMQFELSQLQLHFVDVNRTYAETQLETGLKFCQQKL